MTEALDGFVCHFKLAELVCYISMFVFLDLTGSEGKEKELFPFIYI